MKMRVLSLFAALAFLTACESAPTTGGADAGAGQKVTTAKPATPGSKEDFIANVGDRVFFDYDKSDLRADAKAQLDKQAEWLKKYPNTKALVEGHCDERGTREYNFGLGERRAKSVSDYLKAKGIAAARVRMVSYGKERPAVLGSNDASWAQNRRSVTVVE
ncbi:MAG: peptidoglycan-associated lipoprotein Pal [Alphaproteobacteria bacterium]|nr:peptidoglycan-associated lipoprotein Pal [Alphaproteobacteria bacterium]